MMQLNCRKSKSKKMSLGRLLNYKISKVTVYKSYIKKFNSTCLLDFLLDFLCRLEPPHRISNKCPLSISSPATGVSTNCLTYLGYGTWSCWRRRPATPSQGWEGPRGGLYWPQRSEGHSRSTGQSSPGVDKNLSGLIDSVPPIWVQTAM